MSFLKAIFANMPSLRKRKVEFTESTKTNGSKKLKSEKIQKYSSSSKSESDDETSKNKISPKKQTIQSLTKKHLSTTRLASNTLEPTIEDKNLKADEGTDHLKENVINDFGIYYSDSDEPPLVIDEDSDNDLTGLQKYMRENFGSNNSSPSKLKFDILGIKSSSEDKSPQKNNEKPISDEDVQTQKDVKITNSNADTSESRPDHEEKKETTNTGDLEKDVSSKNNSFKNSEDDTSESDSDVPETQKTIKTVNHWKDAGNKFNLVVSESKSDSEETQKTMNVGDVKTDVKSTKDVNKNSNAVSSDSESDIEDSQKATNKRKNLNKVVKIDIGANKISTIAPLQSEFDTKEKLETTMNTENFVKDVETPEDANKIAKTTSSKSDQKENNKTQDTRNYTQDVNIKVDVEKQSNINTAETEFGEEKVEKDLKNSCNSLTINNDIEMSSELTENKCSDSSEFEFSLGNSSSQEDNEQESSDTEKPKTSNSAVKNKRVYKKKGRKSFRKIPLPVSEEKHEPEEVTSDDSAEEEDLNETGAKSNYMRYKPTEEERKKLVNMLIVVRHPVLPQHKVESTAGTRTMNEHEREEFEKYAKLKHGKFSPEEDKKIKRNWKTFCQDNDWDSKNPRPFLFMKHKNKVFLLNQHSRRKFMRCLAHGLPDRCLYSVFQRFKILFEPHRTCRYESDEDRKIISYIAAYEKKKKENKKKDINEKDRKFAELAIMLSRTRASVWRRYRVLRKKASQESKDDFCYSRKRA